MANILDEIIPKIIARGLMVLRELAIMPRIVNGDYSSDAAAKGDTINVPIPSAVGIIEVAPSVTDVQGSDTVIDKVPIPLDHWFQNDPIYLTDKDMLEINRNESFLPMQIDEAIRAIANKVNLSIHSNYRGSTRGIFGAIGTEGTTPFGATGDAAGVKGATQTRKLLNQQLAPKSNRRGVLDFDAEASALELDSFSDADKIMSAGVRIEGEIGRKYGIDWMSDDQVVTHIAGTIIDGGGNKTAAINNGPGYAIGVNSINVDEGAETTAAGTIVAGDIISFAGHSQTYCIIDNTSSPEHDGTTTNALTDSVGFYTFAANAITGLTFFPALQASVADDEVMTVKDTHVVNIVMHRDAFGFATRPLASQTLSTGDSDIMSIQDPQTGLVLRLEVKRQNKQVAWEFDILWGTRLVRPELAVRLLG